MVCIIHSICLNENTCSMNLRGCYSHHLIRGFEKVVTYLAKSENAGPGTGTGSKESQKQQMEWKQTTENHSG